MCAMIFFSIFSLSFGRVSVRKKILPSTARSRNAQTAHTLQYPSESTPATIRVFFPARHGEMRIFSAQETHTAKPTFAIFPARPGCRKRSKQCTKFGIRSNYLAVRLLSRETHGTAVSSIAILVKKGGSERHGRHCVQPSPYSAFRSVWYRDSLHAARGGERKRRAASADPPKRPLSPLPT